ILGSGFAGTILARALARRGRRVLLLEKGKHPRFALGESSTPLAALSLERLAARYDLPDLHQLAAHGRWQQHLPHLRCGLKRGFTFYGHRPDADFVNDPARNDARLLVAASPNDAIADAHWFRADVDHHLVQRAIDEGVEVRTRYRAETIDWGLGPDDPVTIVGRPYPARGMRRVLRKRGEPLPPLSWDHARFVIDATGRAGVVARRVPGRYGHGFDDLHDAAPPPPVQSSLVFAHFRGVRPLGGARAEAVGAVTSDDPYPAERAAVHHLFGDGSGWLYLLPFDPPTAATFDGRDDPPASAGMVLRRLPDGFDAARARQQPEALWQAVLDRFPALAAMFADAASGRPPIFHENLAYRRRRAAGRRWALLPHSYGFLDPLFSTGIAWSLRAVERLADRLADGGDATGWGDDDAARYEQLLQTEYVQIGHLVEAAHAALGDFDLFTAVTRLYFATVSFDESRERLRPARDDPWRGFLGAGDASSERLFAAAADRVVGLVDDDGTVDDAARAAFHAWLAAQLAPRDVIGLDRPPHPNLLPADLDVLVARADRLGLTPDAVRAALPRLRGDAT
ncbi:MAG: NAD(P)-binding protein, partial [Acidobacteriota bacterium]